MGDRANGKRRLGAGAATRSVAAVALCAALLGGCAWRRVDPRFERVASERGAGVIGLAAADPETSLRDLQGVARLWSDWDAFEGVQFPYRAGDPVDLLVEVALRQRVEAHRAETIAKGVAVGLSFGLLAPLLGPRVTVVQDVSVRCDAGGGAGERRTFELRTDAVYGIFADPRAMAEELDATQTKRLAAALAELVGDGCGAPPAASSASTR